MSMADTLAIVLALAARGTGRGDEPMGLPPAGPEVTIEDQQAAACACTPTRRSAAATPG